MDRFQYFYDLGYTRLCPIIPPGVAISPRSSLYARVGLKGDSRGKAPGVTGRDGLWRGLDWVGYETTAADLPVWSEMGAGVGIRTGRGLIAIDVDVTDPSGVTRIEQVVRDLFGALPCRIGRAPKQLYMAAIETDIPYQRIDIGAERVEFLTDGKQFVACGYHPATGRPYEWITPPPRRDRLPVITQEKIDEFFATIRQMFPNTGRPIKEGAGGADVPQESLVGELTTIQSIMQALPNTHDAFPTREDYLRVGYALKASLPDHPDEAFGLYQDWCDRWDGGYNDPATVASDWRRMAPPYRVGARYLADMAMHFGDASVFDNSPTQTGPEQGYPLLSVLDLLRRPPVSWLIEKHCPVKTLGFLYAEPGAGKSFLALDMALSIAAGHSHWQGNALNTSQGGVLYIAAEGAWGMTSRISCWMDYHNTPPERLQRFALVDRAVNFLDRNAVQRLSDSIASQMTSPPCLVIVDTVSRALPGADENLQKEMTLFIAACEQLQRRYDCTVVGVHHSSKTGAMRGSTVLHGAGDFIFRLERGKGERSGHLKCEKLKDGPDGWSQVYDFIPHRAGEHSSLIVTRPAFDLSPVELTPALTQTILKALQIAADSGDAWTNSLSDGEKYAPRRMVVDYGLSSGEVETILKIWQETGLIRYQSRGPNKGYRREGTA